MLVPPGKPPPSVGSTVTPTVARVLEPQILQSHGLFLPKQHVILFRFPLYRVLWQQFYRANAVCPALLLGWMNA